MLTCKVENIKGGLPDKITSQFGGTRQPISRRYDLLFQEFGDAVDAWAEIIDYGEKKHGHLNWHKLDFETEQSPLNHAIGHLRKAASAKVGSSYRRRQLAKVLWNVAAQMWYDSKQALDELPKSMIPGKALTEDSDK
jgi:hypothetical protein